MVVFDTNLNKINKYGATPECVKNYEILADGKLLVKVENNYQRFKRHRLENTIKTNKLEVKVLETNGDRAPRIYEIRVYKQ